MTSLSDILAAGGGSGDDFRDLWNNTQAANEAGPLPAGDYLADIIAGELEASRTKGTPGYKMTFAVVEPVEFVGRRFWLDCWLTPAAMPQSRRDLRKIAIEKPEQMERPLPAIFRCRVKLALRRDDDGNERNRVRSFEVVGIVEPERDAFAPVDPTPTDATPPATAAEDAAGPTDTPEAGDGIPF